MEEPTLDTLDKSTVIRAGQRPPMFAYVPLDVFMVEGFILVLLFAVFKMWALAFLPLHLLPVVWTAKDLFWTRTMKANFDYSWSVSNKGLYGDRVITFSPAPERKKA
jgi:type IV secretory pathway VirB3-like protein